MQKGDADSDTWLTLQAEPLSAATKYADIRFWHVLSKFHEYAGWLIFDEVVGANQIWWKSKSRQPT